MALTLEEKMKTMSGYCSSCGTEVIMKNPVGRTILMPNFRQHIIKLSNWTLLRVGVCQACKAKLSAGANVQETAETILANHKTYWSFQAKPPKGYTTLTVLDPNTSISKYRRELLLKRHEDALNKSKK